MPHQNLRRASHWLRVSTSSPSGVTPIAAVRSAQPTPASARPAARDRGGYKLRLDALPIQETLFLFERGRDASAQGAS